MQDPFPDKAQLQWSLLTNTKDCIEHLFHCSMLPYFTHTAVRRTLEEGLQVPAGYLDSPMYKTMIRRTSSATLEALAMRRAARRFEELDEEDNDIRRPRECPLIPDVFDAIAEYLNKADLRALSLTCRASCEPAQRAFFRSMLLTITESHGPEWLEKIVAYLRKNFHIARFIQVLTLQTFDLNDNISLSLTGVSDLVGTLPGLVHLTLISFDWIPCLIRAPVCKPHLSLTKLSLLGLFIHSKSSTPLDILSLARQWNSVELEYLTHEGDWRLTFGTPRSIPHLAVHHFPWFSNTKTIPDALHVARDVVTLRCEYLIETHSISMANVVNASTRTLRWLYFRISAFDKRVPLEKWETFFKAIRSCSNLEKLSISISASGNHKTRASIAKQRFDSELMNKLISAASHVRCLDLNLELKGLNKTAATRSFRVLNWELLQSTIQRMPHLEAAGIRFTSFQIEKPAWAAAQKTVLQTAFSRLPFFIDRRPYHIICCKSSKEERTARSLLRDRYGA